LGRAPRGEALEALEAAAVRVGPRMDPQNVANTVYAYAILGKPPGAAAFESLDAATQRVGLFGRLLTLTLFLQWSKYQLMTAGMVHVTNLTHAGSDNPSMAYGQNTVQLMAAGMVNVTNLMQHLGVE
jgi:hypothetical protein